MPLKASSILDCPPQTPDRNFLFFYSILSSFFLMFHLVLVCYISAFSQMSSGDINNTIQRPCVDAEYAAADGASTLFHILLKTQTTYLTLIFTGHYTYLFSQTHSTEKRRIKKRMSPWVGQGIRRIKRWIWRWIWFPQATPRRLTQVEYEWAKCVCMCVWWGVREQEGW